MTYIWRCQKCFRYLSNISITSLSVAVKQRTICPRCKSENKIVLNKDTVIASCGFSRKFDSNLKKIPLNIAPDVDFLLVDK